MRFHETVFGVYFDDLDMFGILHNARYLLFMERCVGEFWRRIGKAGFATTEDPDQSQVVRLNHVEYLRPYEGIGDLRVRLTVEKLGRTSLIFGFRVMPMDQDVDYAVGQRVMVCIDPGTRSPRPWTEGFRQRIAPFLPVEPA